MYYTTQPCASLQVHQPELTSALCMKLYNDLSSPPSKKISCIDFYC